MKKVLITIILFLGFIPPTFANVVMDENQVVASRFEQTETAGKYVSTIDFYESSDFYKTEKRIEVLSYSIMLPVNTLPENASYKLAEGYELLYEDKYEAEHNGIKYVFMEIRIKKSDLKANESILNKEKQKTLTVYLSSNQKDLCSSKLTVKTQKSFPENEINTAKISAVVQKNAINIQHDFIIGFDNKGSKLMGVYYDKNSQYLEVPISIFKDRCSNNDQTFYSFDYIEGMFNIPNGYSIEDVTEINPDILSVEMDKTSGFFSLEYKKDDTSQNYIRENSTGFKVKLKKEIEGAIYEYPTVAIGNYKIDDFEYSGGTFEYLLVPGILGDWNLDGKTNVVDIILARKYVANHSGDILMTGLEDVNKDNIISILDIIWLRKNVQNNTM